MSKALSLLCLLGCLSCLVVFFWFRQESRDEGNTKTDRWTLGFPPSPWLVSTSEEKGAVEKDKTTKEFLWQRRVKFLSFSWLFLLGAVVFWNLFRSLRAGPSLPATDPYRS
jgi:hypothetical protein